MQALWTLAMYVGVIVGLVLLFGTLFGTLIGSVALLWALWREVRGW